MVLRDLKERGRRFTAAYSWMAREHLLANKPALTSILVLIAIGAISQGVMVAFLGFSIDRLQFGTPVGVAIVDESLPDSPAAQLALASICLLLLIGIGGLSNYRATVKTRALARAFHYRCAQWALRVLARSTSLVRSDFPETLPETVRTIQRDPNHMGKALEVLVKLSEPVFRLVVSSVLLLWIEWRLTLLLAPAVLLLVPVVFRLHLNAKEISRRFFSKSAPQKQRRLGGWVRKICQQNARESSVEERLIDRQYAADETILTYFDDYDQLQLAGARMQFAMSLTASVFMLFAFLGGGYAATLGDLSWGLMMAYILALLQAVASLQMVQACLTNLSVFYPAVIRFQNFVGATSTGQPAEATTARRPTSVIFSSTGELAGSEASFELSPSTLR